MRGVGSSYELLKVRYMSNSYFSLFIFAGVSELVDESDLKSAVYKT